MSTGRGVTLTDEQLALAVQAGNARAEAELVARFTALAYALARPYLTARSDSDDMRQEALLAILSAARTFRADGGASFKSLATIAIRRRLFTVIKLDSTMGRKTARYPLSLNEPFDADGDGDEVTLEAVVADPFAVEPHAALIRSERLQAFVRVVRDELTELERAAIVGFLNGRTLVDIFEQLGRGSTSRRPDGSQRPKTAENALDRARRKLRVALEEPLPLGVAA